MISVIIITGCIYSRTLAPTVVEIDSGELATVQTVLGIAHPTGYPIFTLLGRMFLLFPLCQKPVAQLNWLALIWGLGAVVFFMHSMRWVLKNFRKSMDQKSLSENAKGKRKKEGKIREKDSQTSLYEKTDFTDSMGIFVTVVFASLAMAFSKTVWKQCTAIEVHSLQLLVLTAIFYFLYKSNHSFRPNRDWLLVMFFLAIGFANHMTTILIFPGVLLGYFKQYKWNRISIKRFVLLLCIMVFFITIFYLYLPIRASQNPLLNWGNPVTWENFIHHISGKQYRVWLFSSSESAFQNLKRFLLLLPHEFTWPVFIVGLMGLLSSIFNKHPLRIFFIFTFLVTVFYTIHYDIHDLDAYFLTAYVVFAYWTGLGAEYILRYVKKNRMRFIVVSFALFFSIVFEIKKNYSEVDRRNYHTFEDYTKAALESLPQNSLLLSYQWDYLISPAYYFQLVEDFRADVRIIDKELLRRSWYYHQLETCDSQMTTDIQNEVKDFLDTVAPFESGQKFNASLIESRYRILISRLIETHVGNRSVFIAPELVENEIRKGQLYLPRGYRLVPDLFFFRVVSNDAYAATSLPLEAYSLSVRFPKNANHYTSMVRNFIAKMHLWRALYELEYGRLKNAGILSHILRTHFPHVNLPPALAGL